MIRLKGPVKAAYTSGLASELAVVDGSPYSGISRHWGFKVDVERTPYLDWRDTDRQVWLIAVADPWFGLVQIPASDWWLSGSDGAGHFQAFKTTDFQGGALYGTAEPGLATNLYGASVRSIAWPADRWYYYDNYPVEVGILTQQAGVTEPTAYEVGFTAQYWNWGESYPGQMVPENPSWYPDSRHNQSLTVAVPVVAVNLTLSGCLSGGGPLIPNATSFYTYSKAADGNGDLTHWPDTRVEVVGGDWLRIALYGGETLERLKVPSDVSGQFANYYLEHEMWAVYCFAARDAVTWTAPSGCEVLYRTPAGVAPSVMICAEEFQARYWEPGRYATTDTASYLVCSSHWFRAAPHYQVSMARRAGATAGHARTSTRSLLDRQLPQPYAGYTLNMPVPMNSLRAYWHRSGRVELDDQKETMEATIGAEVAVDGPSCDTPTLMEGPDGTLHVLYTRWGACKHQVSADGGETWTEMAELATVSDGYEAGHAAMDSARGMIVLPLFRDGSDGGRLGEWYLTVGAKESGGSYSWSAPQVIRTSADIARYAKPWGASVLAQPDGSWLFSYVGMIELYDPLVPGYLPDDTYQHALICRNLLPDGTGTWEAVPSA